MSTITTAEAFPLEDLTHGRPLASAEDQHRFGAAVIHARRMDERLMVDEIVNVEDCQTPSMTSPLP
jgi:hypothetical protein